MIAPRLTACLAVLALASPVAAAGKFNWDSLGAEFCRLSTAGDIADMRPILTTSLARDIEAAAAAGSLPDPRVLFQTYTNAVPVCTATTKSAALVEIRRSGQGGAAPAWIEYLVIVPEIDGGSRVDDILFATRRSDTLRNRLAAYAGR